MGWCWVHHFFKGRGEETLAYNAWKGCKKYLILGTKAGISGAYGILMTGASHSYSPLLE